jgi:hypothetical protein
MKLAASPLPERAGQLGERGMEGMDYPIFGMSVEGTVQVIGCPDVCLLSVGHKGGVVRKQHN